MNELGARVVAALARVRERVDASGDELARSYLRGLEDEAAADAFAASLRSAPGGALADPFDPAPAGPGPASTARALESLAGLGRMDAPVVEGAAAWLMSGQGADGSFRDPSLAGEDERLELTATLCGLLARTPFVRQRTLVAAAACLEAHWSVERAQAGRLATLAGYLHALSGFPAEFADEVFQWCGRELERGYRTGAFDAPSVARVFVLCESSALPGARIAREELVEGVLAAQAPDGSFAADPTLRGTLQTATALVRLVPAHERRGP